MIKKFIQNAPQITLPFKICINFLLCSCKCLFFWKFAIKYYNNNEKFTTKQREKIIDFYSGNECYIILTLF